MAIKKVYVCDICGKDFPIRDGFYVGNIADPKIGHMCNRGCLVTFRNVLNMVYAEVELIVEHPDESAGRIGQVTLLSAHGIPIKPVTGEDVCNEV